jgi:hypothetical protein
VRDASPFSMALGDCQVKVDCICRLMRTHVLRPVVMKSSFICPRSCTVRAEVSCSEQ